MFGAEELETVAQRWSTNQAGSDAFSADVYWLAVPEVQARHQRRCCAGRSGLNWVEYCLTEHPATPTARRMLSIGCGAGGLERQLHTLGAFSTCDALDIAPGAIETARQAAHAAGISTINYECHDIAALDLPTAHYDAVWFNGSLHHVQNLETVLDRVGRALTKDGRLYFNEYVGANHFDFPQAQKNAIANAFHLIPERYRLSFNPADHGMLATQAPIPNPEEVKRVDPSEAVRAQDILAIAEERFDMLACNAMGGTLLQFLLSGIAGNFKSADPDSIQILDMLLKIEDALIDSGALASDFVIVCAAPKQTESTHDAAKPRRFPPAATPATANAPPPAVALDDPYAENARLLAIIEKLQKDNRWALDEIELLRRQGEAAQ